MNLGDKLMSSLTTTYAYQIILFYESNMLVSRAKLEINVHLAARSCISLYTRVHIKLISTIYYKYGTYLRNK